MDKLVIFSGAGISQESGLPTFRGDGGIWESIDAEKVADAAAWRAEGAMSLLVKGNGIQAVYGPKADVIKSDINDIL